MKPDGTVRIGFIGAGWWATANHMPVFAGRDDVEMTAVCRLGADELQLVKETFGFVHATESYEELLEIEGLDGVVVATPHSLHYEHTMAALRRGLHVMCEKPLATTAAHARAMVEEADRQGVQLLIPHGWHYAPYIQNAKEMMEQNPVGNIEFVMCHMASPVRSLLEGKQFLATGGGAGDNMFEPGAETWADPVIAGGGYALAQMTHSAGMAYWLTGLKADTVFAYNTAPTAQVELYNAFSVGFDGGAIGTFSGAGALPQDQTFQLDIRVFGDEGAFVLDIDRARLEVQRHDGEHIKIDVGEDAGEYYGGGPPDNFTDILLGKDVPNWAPGWAGMRAIEMIDAAYRSAKSGIAEKV
ncbi:MAG: Gfo/Idh/MocA family oxidoreductase [Chloroflexi bacterium]|nr:Gfo/Idh/MocA family oxidoreductase [Chloroflexota bacterium]MYF79098.1 Gfo/Idh/MocA family oxidoreductase [Chloroflexota bacterium]MYK62010.1 Gfo/Idh/MocA family oxidoreductase [Chloroflexota bacterium]